jgi:hypothetical protein
MLTAKPYPEDDGEFDRIDEAINKIRAIASEHFDVGVIMLSRECEKGGTSYHGTQFGNKFAVTGMVEAWANGEFDDPTIECEMEDDDD